jgi:hypothetical protein
MAMSVGLDFLGIISVSPAVGETVVTISPYKVSIHASQKSFYLRVAES